MYCLVIFCLLFLGGLLHQVEAGDKTVLVIGGGNFLGFHTSVLLKSKGFSVTVLDNFDSLVTDVPFRKERGKLLQSEGIKVYHGDLTDAYLLKEFLKTDSLSGVIYDGGGEEERINMEYYTTDRFPSFVTLLDLMKEFKDIPLVYTSYYGVVYKLHTQTLSKKTMYCSNTAFTAIKSSEDSFAKTYCELYGINVVGVRPFNPYGPWAEPYSFMHILADKIKEGKKVDIPYYKDAPVKFALTYASDVANAMYTALQSNSNNKECGVVYNIGEILSLQDIYEEMVGKLKKEKNTGLVDFASPLPLSNLIKPMSGYTPAVSFKEGGSEKFVQWLQSKHTTKKKFEVDRKFSQDVKNRQIKEKSKAYLERINDLREKYEKEATGPVAKFYRHRKFVFFPNYDSGRNERHLKGKSIKELEEFCGSIDECVAFTTDGMIKARIDPKEKWKKTKSGGIYVADIDVCLAGYHNCFGNATCQYLGPSQFKCGCAKGWVKTKENKDHFICSQKEYIEGVKSEMEENNEYFDRLKGHFFKGTANDDFTEKKDSKIEGSTILTYPDANGDVAKLKSACLHTYHCMGFNVKDNSLKISIDRIANGEGETAYVRNLPS